MAQLKRRTFLRIAAGGAAAAAGGAALAVREERPSAPRQVKKIPTFCELCFWKCGVLATVEDGVVTKLDGHPAHPLS